MAQLRTVVIGESSMAHILQETDAPIDEVAEGAVTVDPPGFRELLADGWELVSATGTSFGLWTFWRKG